MVLDPRKQPATIAVVIEKNDRNTREVWQLPHGSHARVREDNNNVALCTAILFEHWVTRQAMEFKTNSRGLLLHNHLHSDIRLEELDIRAL